MSKDANKICPCCFNVEDNILLTSRISVPTLQNVALKNQEQARDFPTGKLNMVQCANCSFVWNKDFEQEVPMYVSNKKMFNILNDVRFSKGEKNYLKNLLKAYKILIKYNFISKNELKFLNAWISDIEHIKKTNAVKLV